MEIIKLNEKISYIEATDDPLSADIGIIHDGERSWLFDVGADRRVLELLSERYHIVLSHFHPDHIGNMSKVNRDSVYMTKNTQRYTKVKGRMVHGDLRIGGVHIFLLPSSHAKGCLGLEVDGEYAFVGDALYCRQEGGKLIFNAQLLQSQLETLKRIDAPYLLVSHRPGLVRSKAEAIEELEAVYARRGEGPDIVIEAF
ncbi:MAG: MBL fold metallo-hydrolase [Clostridia bacterium]|nr:MBL fold metallo-hydrolase [Clostridia bacterium]